MMVVLVAECEKNSLKKTRSVLDLFASRIGNRAWRTIITEDGLKEVRRQLRLTASKNTAVSCHWIRSSTRSDLLWIVGNRKKFNADGIVPIATTQQNIINTEWENDWHYLPLIKALTALSALFHDWGKASNCFQEKLKNRKKIISDPVRHEWISCLLLSTFIKQDKKDVSDNEWLSRLANEEICAKSLKVSLENICTNYKEASPFDNLPKIASLILWLILSHHRLPYKRDSKKGLCIEEKIGWEKLLKNIKVDFGYDNCSEFKQLKDKQLKECFTFDHDLLSSASLWLKKVKKWAAKLQDCSALAYEAFTNNSWRLILYHARLALMLGDHNYSSQDANKNWGSDIKLFANTDRKSKALKQKLDEHLVGVANSAVEIAHLLPRFETELPWTDSVSALQKKSPAIFQWQDKATKAIEEWQVESMHSTSASESLTTVREGFFAVNMASTGCGKTLANAKIMRALSKNGDALRYILALGLRTLTLQTGDEYRDKIKLGKDELAVLIGSKAVKDLHEQNANQKDKNAPSEPTYEEIGSESSESLLEEDIEYETNIPDDVLSTVLKDEKNKQFLYAPVLVCTIDHLISATETVRGGRYILPSLRLMSSDLVIDEVDDFDGKDLIAIGRLVHLAGMLGRKVMISSATIPPAIAEGYFNVYREGWLLFNATRPQSIASINCAWIDEFKTKLERIAVSRATPDEDNKRYREYHDKFIIKRVEKLKAQTVRRKAEIIAIEQNKSKQDEQTIEETFFDHIQQAITDKHHAHHTIDPISGKKVSFGVVRMANVLPCIKLAKYLTRREWSDVTVRVMAYHSRQVLLLRSVQEKHLDCVLKRKEKEGEIALAFKNPIIREHISQSNNDNIIFILVATPVEEVGRDHDFDWAIVEPSSFRSIIQLAGRVKRHRIEQVDKPNIGLLQYNLRALKKEKIAYTKPGYENCLGENSLKTHDLQELLKDSDILDHVTAIPRILRQPNLDRYSNLAELEHYAISERLTKYSLCNASTMQGWLTGYWWLTGFPQQLNRFRDSQKTVSLYRVLDEDDEKLYFAKKNDHGQLCDYTKRWKIKNTEDIDTDRFWLKRDYQELLEEYSESVKISQEQVSLKYGEISVKETVMNTDKDKKYSDQFGLEY